MTDQDREAPTELKAEEPKAPPRSERRIFGRTYRSRLPHGQQYIFVGLALLFLIAWFLFRDSCSRRLGETFGVVTDTPAQDAGTNANARRPRPMPPMSDPDDW